MGQAGTGSVITGQDVLGSQGGELGGPSSSQDHAWLGQVPLCLSPLPTYEAKVLDLGAADCRRARAPGCIS